MKVFDNVFRLKPETIARQDRGWNLRTKADILLFAGGMDRMTAEKKIPDQRQLEDIVQMKAENHR